MKSHRIGIVGLGTIARNIHIPVLSTFKDVNIEAATDINIDRAERIADRWKIKKIYRNYEEMYEKTQLDAVFVCVPPALHYPVAKSALEHDLHVFCEKPMGVSSRDAIELMKVSQKRGLVLGVGYNLRVVKNYVRAAKTVESMLLGRILQIHAVLTRAGPYVGWMPSGKWYFDEVGGGVLYDLGSHLLDLVSYILSDKIATVFAKSVNTMHLNVLDNVVGVFETENGAIGTVGIGWGVGVNYDYIHVQGTAGNVFASPLEFKEMYGSFDMLDEALSRLRSAKQIFKKGISIMLSKNQFDTYLEQDRAFIDSINVQSSQKPYASAEDAIHTLKVIEAFENSIKAGIPVAVENVGQ